MMLNTDHRQGASPRDRASTSTITSAHPAHMGGRSLQALADALRASDIEVHIVRSWDQLLAARTLLPDVILVDYDVIGIGLDGGPTSVSGHRLVTLLAHELANQPAALIVFTALDYAEIEDLAQAGVHAFISPDTSHADGVALVRASVARQRARCGAALRAPAAESSPATEERLPTLPDDGSSLALALIPD